MGSRNAYLGSTDRGESKSRKEANPYGLSDVHVQFCYAYTRTLSQGAAYAEVYPNSDLTKTATAVYRIWRKPGIQELIKDIMAKVIQKYEGTLEEVVGTLFTVMKDTTESGSARVAAADKLMKYFNGYEKHQNAGSSKNLYLGMTAEELDKQKALILGQLRQTRKELDFEDFSENIGYEEIQDSGSAE